MDINSRIIEFRDLGKITLRKSHRARRISISLRPFEGIRVTVPYYMSFKQAERFILEKESWLRKAISKIDYAERSFTIFDWGTCFHTADHSLIIRKIPDGIPHVKVTDGNILVFCPENRDIKEKNIQHLIRRGIEYAWRKEAKKYLIVRLRELTALHGFEIRKTAIKNTRSRWGSCSGKNNINLSIHLMRLPRYLSDYVMLHELAHTIHKNHSKTFWRYLDTLTGDAKKLDRELKKYRTDIY